ncbi:four helix bundle protein [Aeoliella sp. ICT_H6.2]|uniref:Four helix bundle protein n=1 Tax=Aeoliella straminimaris TaxID=2954799 RepID=A0A9X2FGB3_9BACT|nr:four helix bundle protein [Aeoliella straminimaris]MCO6047823.1 four helix bundle protein [Aeoliella straminimaris]
MGRIDSYRDLKVWQLGVEITLSVYNLTKEFPTEERYGLCSQLRRCAVSIPSNIAEGHARDSSKEYLHHLSIASGSLAELETQLIIAKELGYLIAEHLASLLDRCDEESRMLSGLQRSIRHRISAATRP